MRMKTLLLALATFSLVSAPTMAAAQVDPYAGRAQEARAGAQLDRANSQVRGGFFIPLLAVLAVVLGVLAAVGGDEDRPTSP